MNEELKVIISAEVAKFKQGVDDAKKTVSNFVKEGTKDFEKLNDEFQKVGDKAKGFLKGVGGAVAGATTAFLALGPATAELRTNQAKLATAFETAGASAEVATGVYNDLYRVLGDDGQAVEAANHLAKLTTEEKALSEWTTICQGVYATFGESIPIESLAEGAAEASRTGTITAGLTDALVWCGVAEDEFNEKLQACTTQQEREKLIRETLNGLYTDAAAGYEETAADILAQNEAQAKMNESMAELGEVAAPIMTMLSEFATEVLAQLTPYITEFAEKHGPELKKALSGIGDAVGKVISWIADNWGLVSTLAAIVLGIAAALSVFSTVMGVVNAVMLASPVSWIVLAIVAALAALVAIIVVVIKHWDEIKAATLKVWNAIVDAVKKAVNNVVEWFTNLRSKTAEKIESLKQAAVEKFENLKSSISTKVQSIVSSVTEKFDSIRAKIREKIDAARDAVKSAIDKIKGFFNFSWSLPKLKMPTISITGKFSLSPLSVPKFSIKWNELGGVFDKPTLFNYGGSLQGLGENGAEAVVPLENNLEWLNKLANMLNERMGNNPVVLNVDGKVFAETAISTINKHTRQTGKLALNLI